MYSFARPFHFVHHPRRRLAAVVAIAVLLTFLAAVAHPSRARADSSPPAGTPRTVSADALPTWQVNGVVWAQVTVGNTVYVTGNFTSARPPGSGVGVNEVTRSNLLAYDITTGNLITTFNHSLNGQGLALAVSPDGTKLFVGGDFTAVDGVTHSRIAEFSLPSGAVATNFKAVAGTTVRALFATNTNVYAGGDFAKAGSSPTALVARSYLAAFDSASGAMAAWNPGANASVLAMTASPDKTKLIVGGRFTTLAGASRYGIGAVDLVTGAATTWNTSLVVRDAGAYAGITTLSSDGANVYGGGYVYGAGGNFEGRFAISATGNLVWMNDCHGDTYSAYPIGSVLYAVAHSHNCQNMGSFPDTSPRVYRHAFAETTYATGHLATNVEANYANFGGQPDGTQLNWYPALEVGTFTGQLQAAWSVTGNASYVALGGEFPRVNGVLQQGLTRFAVSSLSPNKIGPSASASLTPTATTTSSTSVKLTWGATSDLDNGVLTYKVYRDGVTTPIGSTTADSRFYSLPQVTFTDASPPSGTHTYVITATDPFGNTVSGSASNAVTTTGGNAAPVVSFTTSCSTLTCSFSGSSVTQPVNTAASYAWNFGDGTTGTGASSSHQYAANGTYSVTLTVTDKAGLKGAKTQSITVTAVTGGAGVFAADAFTRTVTGGLGTADIGGSWTAVSGAAAQSVASGTAKLTLSAASATTIASLSSVSKPGAVVTSTVAFDKVASGGGAYYSIAGRRIDSTHEYRANVHLLSTGNVAVYLTKLDGSATDVAIGSQVQLASALAAGARLNIKFSVVTSGTTTTLGLKAWPAGTTEPAAWQVTGADSSAALQGSGSVGMRGYLSGSATNFPVTVSVSAFQATQP